LRELAVITHTTPWFAHKTKNIYRERPTQGPLYAVLCCPMLSFV